MFQTSLQLHEYQALWLRCAATRICGCLQGCGLQQAATKLQLQIYAKLLFSWNSSSKNIFLFKTRNYKLLSNFLLCLSSQILSPCQKSWRMPFCTNFWDLNLPTIMPKIRTLPTIKESRKSAKATRLAACITQTEKTFYKLSKTQKSIQLLFRPGRTGMQCKRWRQNLKIGEFSFFHRK